MIFDQALHGQASLFSYALLPLLSSFFSERKLNLTYGSVSSVGWPAYFALLAVYLTFVEIGIYWMHRTLHTNKFLYKHVHLMHHKYNKPDEVWRVVILWLTELVCRCYRGELVLHIVHNFLCVHRGKRILAYDTDLFFS